MKRVLQIAAGLTIGGAEKVTRDIGLYADPASYECHYVVFGDNIGEYEAQLRAHGCRIFHFPSPSDSYSGYVSALKELMREYPYQAVHAHTMFNAGWVMQAARQMGVPVRVAHAHSILDESGGIVTRAYETAMRSLIVRNATHLVACGQAAGVRLFGKKAYGKRGQLILNGIDTARFSYDPARRQAMREKLGLEDAFVVGHVGHLAEVKNQKFLLSLMPELQKRRENTVLLLLGEGEDRPMLEALAKPYGSRVIMTGNVENVYDYLCAMDVFAFPSLYEGMPLSIVEVQANGLPCILSDRVPKDVFLTGLLTALPLEKPELWIDAICGAQRSEPERYGAQLRERGFDVTTVVQKFYDIYESV